MGKSSYEELEKELKELKNSDIRPLKENHYGNFFDNMSEMVEVIELIYDDNNQPIDFYIRVINTSFAKFLGKTKKQLVNKKVSSIVDKIEENWFTSFALVDKTGEPHSFKNYVAALDQYYLVSVWKVSENNLGVSYIPITKTEKNKMKLNKELKNEKRVRTEAEFLLKDGKLELYESTTADKEHAFQYKEKEKRADELAIANEELAFQNNEKDNRADELVLANKELAFQNKEKEKRADELAIANKELAFQNKEKEKRADELDIANKELAFQNEEKGKRADELAIAKKELIFQKELDSYRSEAERVALELTLLIDTANAPIFGIDSKGLVNEWNQTSEKITGFKKDEVLGKNLVQTYITEDYRKSVKKVLDDALRGKETANYEFPLFTKNGERVMVLLNSSSRRDANGKITGVLGVGQDITELVGYRNELEIKVEERTIKLNQALEKQKELNELKSKFVSTASHEFRTPLSAINFAAGSIKKYWGKMEPVMVEKKLHKIEDQVMHMTKLLDDILIIGQAGAGKIRNNPLNMPLGNFINEIIEEVYTSHEKSNQIVVIDTENIKNKTIFIDEKLGRNIFINLISNAVKYSKNKENVTITFSSEKDFIIVTVTDSGIGISKSELKTIFTPFSRGEHVDLIQGTGLGLSIAKEAIDAIGGEIIVSSKIGLGATFKVKVPKNKNNV
jgi:PAS domain S-box-containing protein